MEKSKLTSMLRTIRRMFGSCNMAFKLFSNLLIINKTPFQNCKPIQLILSGHSKGLHSTAVNHKVEKWTDQNEWVYPPQKPGEPRRAAFVNHVRENIKYSPKKMWYVASLVRGMSVDEAIKQLSFIPSKGAIIVKEVIEEAQELAVREHNVEFRSNLWVAESNVGKALIMKGLRKHARMRIGIIHYRYCHYFVRLVEGLPPKVFYEHRRELTGNEKLEEYFNELRSRRIHRTL